MMMRRRSSNLAAECEILARYRPIAPKPAGAPNISIAATPSFPAGKRSRSSSSSSPSAAAAAAFKKLRSSAAAISSSSWRPLIPAFHRLSSSSISSSTSSSSCLTDASDTRSELKTLPLLPDALSSSDSSSLTSSSRAASEDPLTELSLGSERSKGLKSPSEGTNGAPQSWSNLDALLFDRCAQPMAVTDVRSGGVLWSNRAFAAARDGELQHPVPLLSLTLGSDSPRVAQLWIFITVKDALSPSKPQPVRASIATSVLDSLESPATRSRDRGRL